MEKHKIKSDSQAFRLVSYFITTQKGIFINMWIAKVNISLSTVLLQHAFWFPSKKSKIWSKKHGCTGRSDSVYCLLVLRGEFSKFIELRV